MLTRAWIDPSADPLRDAEVSAIASHPPVWETKWVLPEDESKGMKEVWRYPHDIVNYYYWYYGLLAMQRYGGEAARGWREAMVQALLSHQVAEGALSGSWEPLDPWGRLGGRLYSTSYAVLSLLAAHGR